ncbi:unnamed protein product [Peniophora sp. CBMAI 1063]|nr:unnamed protein product [Peniophora sp. CBMAI 1063]
MVHLRLNETEANPNPYINFITALPASTSAETESARQLLRALAAQVKPVMKAHGFVVNSFEEYENNKVFWGRNWNAGETVELVLRRADGSWLPHGHVMSTLCHELAHIRHMNHNSDFQKLWRQLNWEVRVLQAKGYFGDGLWSAGTRLKDSQRVEGLSEEAGELPEYICGGAQTTSRPSRRRRQRQPRAGASSRTGAQTTKRRKAGSRVTGANVFTGSGQALDTGSDDKGKGFRKQAGSKRAREERAAAVEKRLAALAGKPQAEPTPPPDDSPTEDETDDEVEIVPETDSERRRALADAKDDGLTKLRPGMLEDFWGDMGGDGHDGDFVGLTEGAAAFGGARDEEPVASGSGAGAAGPSRETVKARKDTTPKKTGPTLKKKTVTDPFVSDSDDEIEVTTGYAKSKGRVSPKPSSKPKPSSSQPKKEAPSASIPTQTTLPFAPPPPSKPAPGPGLGNLVRDEMRQRRAESLGMTSGGRTLGGTSSARTLGGGDGGDRMPDREARLAALDRLQKADPTRPSKTAPPHAAVKKSVPSASTSASPAHAPTRAVAAHAPAPASVAAPARRPLAPQATRASVPTPTLIPAIPALADSVPASEPTFIPTPSLGSVAPPIQGANEAWTCSICTLVNDPLFLVCEASSAPFGTRPIGLAAREIFSDLSDYPLQPSKSDERLYLRDGWMRQTYVSRIGIADLRVLSTGPRYHDDAQEMLASWVNIYI